MTRVPILMRHNGFVSLSRPYVLDKYESRVLHDSAVAIQREIVRETKAVKERKAAIRMGHCMIAQPSQETNFKMQCRCGGVAFSTDKFASHEKTKKHNSMFGNHNWSDFYFAAGIDSGGLKPSQPAIFSCSEPIQVDSEKFKKLCFGQNQNLVYSTLKKNTQIRQFL